MKNLEGNTKTVFLAIAAGTFATCAVKGPARAASVGALKKMALVAGQAGGYALTAAGRSLYADMQPLDGTATGERAKISNRSAGYVALARKKFGSQIEDMPDLTLVSQAQLWRITKPEAALAKVQAVFRLAA